jgi:hypothetical protein
VRLPVTFTERLHAFVSSGPSVAARCLPEIQFCTLYYPPVSHRRLSGLKDLGVKHVKPVSDLSRVSFVFLPLICFPPTRKEKNSFSTRERFRIKSLFFEISGPDRFFLARTGRHSTHQKFRHLKNIYFPVKFFIIYLRKKNTPSQPKVFNPLICGLYHSTSYERGDGLTYQSELKLIPSIPPYSTD